MDEIEAARALLREARTVTVVGHERPDGDAVGSLLGLSLSLELAGLAVTPVLSQGLPERFGFLPGAERVQPELPDPIGALILVDCSEFERAGFGPHDWQGSADMNIDHHPTNTEFAKVNLVRPQAAATAELLHDLAPQLDLPVDARVATNWMAGLVSDTIGFRTSNVTSNTMRVAAELLDLGAPLADLYDRLLNRRSFASARYWGSGLVKLERAGGLLWASLTLEDRLRAGYHGSDDADLVNLLCTIEGARVVLLFVEQPGRKVKVSWRSLDGQDVSKLAEQFGGGGHMQAAGAMIEGELEEVKSRVRLATESEMEPIGGPGG